MSASAFQALPRGGLSRVAARVPRATCGLRMQADVEASGEVADDAEEPKLSRAQRRMQGKYTKKNTDGSLKATQQVGTVILAPRGPVLCCTTQFDSAHTNFAGDGRRAHKEGRQAAGRPAARPGRGRLRR